MIYNPNISNDLFLLSLQLQVKKEIIAATKTGALFTNDLYRKENVQLPLVVPKTNNYGRNNNNNNNHNQYQNQLKIKGQNQNIQEAYFPSYYPKHPPQPPPPSAMLPQGLPHQTSETMFAKHEPEFHQKNLVIAQQQFPPFHAPKFDVHDYEHHNVIKGDTNHKIIANNIHARTLEFPQNQIYYNENNAANPQNQYYHNDFDASGNDGNAGYFDPKTQSHYYEMNYHHHGGGSGNAGGGGGGGGAGGGGGGGVGSGAGNEYSEMYGPNTIVNENCENFSSFQQYYEHTQQQHQQQQHQQAHQQSVHPQAHPHYHHPSQNAHAAYVHQHNFPNSNPQAHANPNLTENSNSSSDFNFLSNLNDFAPEYYQLS